MSALVRSEREILEEKLEGLYKEQREAIGDEERFKMICSKIAAIQLKFFTWDNRENWLSITKKVPYQSIELVTLNIK
jgi:hypothetical protein